ncbi:hypothetical protein WM06_17065 [Burkholderia cepacia]|uniref:DUF4393 domain-containing protein n=1 Tax=Burkholderia cepacia TaxID=292 RepID=UPI00075C969E|nr:DUF4393 domain-containing protein [Burkholderia cepacia]KWI50895.1 hypothetical protein WM06_17065 [Burkholderia cepacia]
MAESESDNKSPFDDVKTAAEIIGSVMKIAGDDPQVKQAGANLAKTAVVVTETVNNLLLPLALVNAGVARARRYFETKFAQDFEETVTARIPPEHLQEPKMAIAGPVMQGLAYDHEEPDLKALYLELLASAMDSRNANVVHRGFIDIIRQIDPGEAHLLRVMMRGDRQPICQLVVKVVPGGGQIVLAQHVMALTNSVTKAPEVVNGFQVMVDNWIRLGLFRVDYAESFTDESQYAWVTNRPEYIQALADFEGCSNRQVAIVHGIISTTYFGRQFAQAVGMLNPPQVITVPPAEEQKPA